MSSRTRIGTAAERQRSVPRIKGSAIAGTVRFLRKYADEAQKILPAHLQRYLDGQRILPSSWYPEADQLELVRALAKLAPKVMPGVSGDVYSFVGQWVARKDLTCAYTSLVRSDAEGTVRAVEAAWKQYHDTGRMEARLEAPGKASFELTDYGLPSFEMCRILTGWYTEFFIIAGGIGVQLSEVKCRTKGATSCMWHVTWK